MKFSNIVQTLSKNDILSERVQESKKSERRKIGILFNIYQMEGQLKRLRFEQNRLRSVEEPNDGEKKRMRELPSIIGSLEVRIEREIQKATIEDQNIISSNEDAIINGYLNSYIFEKFQCQFI